MAQLSLEQWKEVSPFLEQALSLPDVERASFVASVREQNSSAADLLQTLLNDQASIAGKRFLEGGPFCDSAIVGQTLGPYQVEGLLGAGGMGEVYRALDTRLSRTVAIKVLPRYFSSDPDRRLRFEREAKAISALQNRNICVLYDVGRQGDVDYLVMEYLEGETLGQWIQRSQAQTAEERLPGLLDIAIQTARGLEAAHRKGIVHRDVKPANIFITRSGDVKILDFGIAKSFDAAESAFPENGDSAPRGGADLQPAATRTGLAVGTPLYWSPEQVRGEKVDARSDLFSFGLVLYEMTTGRRTFAGDSDEQIRVAVLCSTPLPIRSIDPKLPSELERIIQKAFSKEREIRYNSAADLCTDLEKLQRQIEARRTAARRWRSPWMLGAAALAIAATISGTVLYRLRQERRLTEKDSVVLADFSNSTGERVFDSTLNQALSITLNQSPFLNVLSGDVVKRTLASMARPPETALSPAVARELCQRAGSRVYISGTIAGLGSEYVLGLKAVNCRTGNVLAEEQASAASRDKVLGALDVAARKLRSELGESLASLQKFDLPLEEATTSSLDALEAYSTGEVAYRTRGEEAALPYHLRAIQLDPNFALAYLSTGFDYNGLGEATRGNDYLLKAYQLREHSSRRENMAITAAYHYYVTGDLNQAEQSLHNLLANYPRMWGPHAELGNVYTSEGLYAKGADEYRQAQSLFQDAGNNYGNLANTLLALQRYDQARQVLEEAQTHKLDQYLFHMQWYALAFLKGDPKGMDDQQRWFSGRPEVAYDGLALASDTEAYTGHLNRSRELTRQSVDSAIRADDKESGAVLLENAALREAAFNNGAQARRFAAEGLKLAPQSQGAQAEAALALAMTGDTSRPVSLMKEIDQRYPLDTQVHALWLATVQAQLALNRRDPAGALAALPDIGAMELGQVSYLNNVTCLYRTYVHGDALLAAGQGAAAAAEFQKILDHSGMVWNCWTGAAAHLGLARANALLAKSSQSAEGNAARDRAIATYREFFLLWKDADPEIPLLKQAKAEYARLERTARPAGVR